jgi:hypothetical protein
VGGLKMLEGPYWFILFTYGMGILFMWLDAQIGE